MNTSSDTYIGASQGLSKKSNIIWKKKLIQSCYGLDVCVPHNSGVEILRPKVMLLGGGASGQWLGYESWAIMNRISDLLKGT